MLSPPHTWHTLQVLSFQCLERPRCFVFIVFTKQAFPFLTMLRNSNKKGLRPKEDFWCTNHSLSRTTEWGNTGTKFFMYVGHPSVYNHPSSGDTTTTAMIKAKPAASSSLGKEVKPLWQNGELLGC